MLIQRVCPNWRTSFAYVPVRDPNRLATSRIQDVLALEVATSTRRPGKAAELIQLNPLIKIDGATTPKNLTNKLRPLRAVVHSDWNDEKHGLNPCRNLAPDLG